jgi:hypothetical protein
MMRELACEERRMLRALHDRWPYRRLHCRHDLHWLVRVRPRADCYRYGRAHPIRALAPMARRPLGR